MGFFTNQVKRNVKSEESEGWRSPGGFIFGTGLNNYGGNAMQSAAFFAGLRLISGCAAGLPLHLKRPTEDGSGMDKAKDLPLYQLLHDAPNPNMSAYVFWETGVIDLATQGDFFIFKDIDNKGNIYQLVPIPPQNVTVRYDEQLKKIVYDVMEGNSGKIKTYFKDTGFRQIIHIPGFGYDYNTLRGKNVIQNFKDTFGLNQMTLKYGNDFFKQGLTAGSILTYEGDLDEENRADFEEKLKQYSGMNGNQMPLALPPDWKYEKSNALTPADLCWLEIMKFTVADIANILSIPRHFLMDTSSGTYANVEQNMRQFVDLTLQPYLRRIEQQIWLDCLTKNEKQQGIKAEFNTSALVRADFMTLVNAMKALHNEGIANANEIRDYLGMNAQSGNYGNEYFGNGNLRPLSLLAASPAPTVVQVPSEGGDNNNGKTI